MRCTSLHIYAGKLGIVQLLLDRGAAIDTKDSHNMTVLHKAISNLVTHLEIGQWSVRRLEVKLLYGEHDPDFQDNEDDESTGKPIWSMLQDAYGMRYADSLRN